MADEHEGRRRPMTQGWTKGPALRAALERHRVGQERIRLNGGWQAFLPPPDDLWARTHRRQPRDVTDQFVVKLHSRCNLACDYCYMYRAVDQTWVDRPRVMSRSVIDALVRRVSDHARRHDLATVMVTLHGGEPLLAGPRVLDHLAGAFRSLFATQRTELQMTLQTNGVLLDERFLEVLRASRVTVGVSLDGGARTHDRARPTKSGRGSYEIVVRRLALLRSDRYRHLFGGLLCTVDLRHPPIETYDALLEQEPPAIDFLLPHATWDTPPSGGADGRYADWLIAVFDQWYDSPSRTTGVRLFDSLIDLYLGGESTTAIVGPDGAPPLVIETDGAIEYDDSLKVVAHGASATGYNVIDNDFADLVTAPEPLSSTCLRCSVVDLCGGGLRTHRYRGANAFDNPSVYCRDLRKLVQHVHDRLYRDVPELVAVRQ